MIKKIIGFTILLLSSLLTHSQKINTKKPFHPKYNYMQLIDSTSEKINMSKFGKPIPQGKNTPYEKLLGVYYRDTLSDSTIVEAWGTLNNYFYTNITPSLGWFEIYKTYYGNGVIQEKGLLRNGKEYGKWYTFDSTGSLIKTIDYDAPYKLHFEQLLRLARDYCRKYGYEVSNTDIHARNTFGKTLRDEFVDISRSQGTLGNLWTVVLSRPSNKHFKTGPAYAEQKIIVIDDTTGQVASVKEKMKGYLY